MDKLTGEGMTKNCALCQGPVNPHDLGTWKQVIGWVHGPRKDSMTLRQDTGLYAHEACIQKARAGQPQDQPDLFEEPKRREVIDIPVTDEPSIDEAFEILDEYHNRVCIGENDGRCKCP